MPLKTRQDRGAGTDEQLGMDQEPPSSTELQATASLVEGSVSELASLVKVLLQSQAARDDRMEQVMAKQDQRWRNMQHQFQQIQHQVIQIQAGGDHRGSQAALTVTSPEPTGEGKARGAYVAMDGNDAEDYEKVKEAILMKYQINAEIYRQRFRSSEILPDENPRELYVRLKDLFSKWVKPERCTIQQLSELIILEQFMRMINSDMAVWIKEHDPATAEEAAKLAETYLAARQEAQHSFGGRSQKWPIQPCYAVTRAQSAIADFKEMPFAGVDIEVAVGKRRTSKKERRKRKFEGSGKEQVEELPLPECSLDMIIPEDIAEVQKNDPTLQDWFQKVSVVDGVRKKVGLCLVDEEYIVKKGILYQDT
ncbi:zinc finger and SCAN domain-containing protein [Pimephales promelas]|nr:zinc finger and SCAN domain-containing protein [Pimephales promelas]